MPKVYYQMDKRRVVINGIALPAEPIQAKRIMEVFGLNIDQELDLYTGLIREQGKTVAVSTDWTSKVKKTKDEVREQTGRENFGCQVCGEDDSYGEVVETNNDYEI